MAPDVREPQTDREWLMQIAADVRELRNLAGRVASLERWRWLAAGAIGTVMAMAPLGVAALMRGR